MELVERINIFGTQVSITNKEKAPDQLKVLIGKGSGFVCLPDAYVIVIATKNDKLRQILNNSLLTLPDGSPLANYAKRKGIKNISTVSGYWLIKALLKSNVSHYFYGSSEQELSKIKQNLLSEFPNAKVLGYKSPPWVTNAEIETDMQIANDIEEINNLQPNFIWIGMNSPKQDYLMAAYASKLDNSIMIGVGGVYDYLSGTMKISPEWVKKLSLRWVYRIAQSPKRLFKKTIIAIFGFSFLSLKELLSNSSKL